MASFSTPLAHEHPFYPSWSSPSIEFWRVVGRDGRPFRNELPPAAAIRLGLFFYGFPEPEPGNAPEACEAGGQPVRDAPGPSGEQEQLQEVSERDPAEGQVPPVRARLPGFNTEIWFEDCPREVDSKLQNSLARLHVNMGHAPKAELVRMLAAAGNLSKRVLTGLDCLRCGSCIRTRIPRPPPTSSSASIHTGFFGEVLQSDIVYVRLITGEAVPVIGISDEATAYHTAKVLPSRAPTDVLSSILEIWYRPLGLPLHFKCDQDGAYGGEVASWHARHGILHDQVPAEAHNRIGRIERRNALMRTLAERVIDNFGIALKKELDQALVAILHTINSCTFSYGRSPSQAVFGKVARPLGDLISDPRSLVLSPSDQDGRLSPELLRADALRALAEHNASSAMRRALLRRTRPQQDLHGLQPGQPVAYWRWSGKSRQHKKGSWCLARFLAADPDQRSSWLQVNSTTVKVANNQLRCAVGWESWTPTSEDIAILKDADRNER